MKRTLLVILTLLPMSVSLWADAVEINGVYYNLIDKIKTAEVTKHPNHYKGDVTIPDTVEYEGKMYRVTSIGNESFIECADLTAVTIGNKVTSIGEYAFARCVHLTSVTLGNSVQSIGYRAFRDCIGLTSVTIPNSVISIGEESFGECGGLTSVTIGNSVKSIGKLAFHQCNGLTSIEIPNSVTTIGEYAFYQCSGLASITIPNSVTSIDQYAFAQCTSLKSMELPNSITKIAGHTFRECKSLTSIVIPDGVTEIAGNAFYCCTGLTSVEIPNSVTTMGWGAFQGCIGLLSVNISDSLKEIGMYIFSGCTGLTSVTIPKNVQSIGEYSFSGCTKLKSIEIPNSVRYIKGHTFYGCSSLTSITIGTDVQSIGEYAFANCPEITDVYCYANKIPTTASTCFSNSYTEYATLHVLAVYVKTMMTREPWSNFMNIVALPTPGGIAINETNFPDENFRNWVLGQAYGTDSVLTDEEIEKVTGIAFYNENFHHLDGIGYFNELKTLTFSQCTVSSLDVSGLSKLEELQCSKCSLSASGLNVSGCAALKSIVCYGNQLTSLDVSGCVALKSIDCSGNQLTSLDVSGCAALEELSCNNNQLTSLEVSGCAALKSISCYRNQLTSLDASGCTALVEINCYENNMEGAEMDAFIESLPTVSDGMLRIIYGGEDYVKWIDRNMMTTAQVKAAKAKGWIAYIMYQGLWHEMAQEGIVINETSFPDANFRNWVLSQGYGTDGVLTDEEIAGIVSMSISTGDVRSLQGIEFFTSLVTLICSNNMLTTLDVSKNTQLESLYCSLNQLTSLNVENNPVLQRLICDHNQLSSLDLSGCTALQSLICYQNQIKDGEMDVLVESLPIVNSGDMYVVGYENEQNVMTTTQVNAAKAKGWQVYCQIKDSNNTIKILPYDGVEDTEMAYRSFIEEDKVWKVGQVMTGKEAGVQIVSYLYFDGDTIVNGQTAKRMLRDKVATEEWESLNVEGEYVGAWYEKDKKVYCMNVYNDDFELIYDFSLNVGDTINLYDYIVYGDNGIRGVVTKRATGGLHGFKGNYLDILAAWGDDYESEEESVEIPVVYNQKNQWLEGVGSDYPPLYPRFISFQSPFMTGSIGPVLMSCTVGDEVIYYNSEINDPYNLGAKKRRFDFNHTIKTQPKTPRRAGELDGLYGEYNDQQLNVKLDPLNELYEVQITTGKTSDVIYSKTINAKNIVALNINISNYPESQYTVTIENSQEVFTGMFDTTATAIEETPSDSPSMGRGIFNLQGQRIETMQKGLNIVDGKKVWVR